jgi:uncharacterized protein with PIN domain
VKFWDTSALVPLLVEEPTTGAMRAHLAEDGQVIVWMLTSVELLSTLGRLGRQTAELADLLPGVRADAMQLFARWSAVIDVPAVARRAERLVGVHPLAAADAMQLGAALLASVRHARLGARARGQARRVSGRRRVGRHPEPTPDDLSRWQSPPRQTRYRCSPPKPPSRMS